MDQLVRQMWVRDHFKAIYPPNLYRRKAQQKFSSALFPHPPPTVGRGQWMVEMWKSERLSKMCWDWKETTTLRNISYSHVMARARAVMKRGM